MAHSPIVTHCWKMPNQAILEGMRALSPGLMPDVTPVIRCRSSTTGVWSYIVDLCLKFDREQRMGEVLDSYEDPHEKGQEMGFGDDQGVLDQFGKY